MKKPDPSTSGSRAITLKDMNRWRPSLRFAALLLTLLLPPRTYADLVVSPFLERGTLLVPGYLGTEDSQVSRSSQGAELALRFLTDPLTRLEASGSLKKISIAEPTFGSMTTSEATLTSWRVGAAFSPESAFSPFFHLGTEQRLLSRNYVSPTQLDLGTASLWASHVGFRFRIADQKSGQAFLTPSLLLTRGRVASGFPMKSGLGYGAEIRITPSRNPQTGTGLAFSYETFAMTTPAGRIRDSGYAARIHLAW